MEEAHRYAPHLTGDINARALFARGSASEQSGHRVAALADYQTAYELALAGSTRDELARAITRLIATATATATATQPPDWTS